MTNSTANAVSWKGKSNSDGMVRKDTLSGFIILLSEIDRTEDLSWESMQPRIVNVYSEKSLLVETLAKAQAWCRSILWLQILFSAVLRCQLSQTLKVRKNKAKNKLSHSKHHTYST